MKFRKFYKAIIILLFLLLLPANFVLLSQIITGFQLSRITEKYCSAMGVKFLFSKPPFVLFTNEGPKKHDIVLGIVHQEKENITTEYLSRISLEDYVNITYNRFNNGQERYSFSWQESTNGGRIFDHGNIILYDYNNDDIWDVRIVLGDKVATKQIFMDGAWLECHDLNLKEKEGHLKDHVAVHWNLEKGNWENNK
ncbi:hypothetical protein [Victivallis sp. Marseille-Q1083]|uniref:hypothetical protein n=1 Tax=Victivallis sp. Marseille-Q1083 TaxID=2717288 RepID=UPI00158D0FF3|nr:hypothetical protein [Victivallis sp. Marseille-Q1083]